MKSFIIKLTVLTFVVVVVGWIIFSLFLSQYYLSVLPFLLIFFFIVTILIHAYQTKLAKKDLGKFARSNMLITFSKLIVYSIVAFLYIAFDPDNAIVFVVCLMILYLIYTFFEVAEATKVSQSQQKKQ